MTAETRTLSQSANAFVAPDEVALRPIGRIEGAKQADGLAIKPLMVGEGALLMEVHRKAGLIDPEHAHPDHESICYLVSGRMRVVIDGDEFIAEPGATWIHRPGVRHYHETLEDSVQIEIKSPPRRTWE